MTTKDVQDFVNQVEFSDAKLVIPVLEEQVQALIQRAKNAGYYCYLQTSIFGQYEVVITDRKISKN
jgi:hypothetical protein